MSDSEEGEIDISREENDRENDISKKSKIKKSSNRSKKAKKQGKIGQFISSNYRKQKCDFFNKGNCLKGNLCTYSHDFQPDTVKKICKFYLSGSCSKGEDCQYSHNTKIYPCKFFHIQNRCNLSFNCRFSHGPIASDFYQEYMKDNKDFILKLYKQNKLINKDFIQFIQDELPKKDVNLPSIMSTSATNQAVKKDNNIVRTNNLNKDPRQRFKPKAQQSEAINPIEGRIIIKQEEQKKIQIKEESMDEKFINCLKSYFYSYY